MTNPPSSADQFVAQVRVSHARLLELLTGLDDEQVGQAADLPGWTRGHVLAHLADNARAFARQARRALRGALVDLYDGGPRERDRAIARGATRTAVELREELRSAQKSLEAVWDVCTADDWARPVRFRHATVLDTVQARWREAEIHAVDLRVGYSPRDWSARFALHALDFLAPRTPEGIRLVLRADDIAFTRTTGTGDLVEVSGASHDLAAWMAGRAPAGQLRSSTGTLPEPGPWPPDPAD
ncbi:maleylpyruvate isomerase family mycothiol-dependent enzyme [Streptomyces sp. NPDC001920]